MEESIQNADISTNLQKDTFSINPELHKKELGNELVENKAMSRYLCSDKFIESLHGFEINNRKNVIGLAIEYLTLHPDGLRIEEYLENLKEVGHYKSFDEVVKVSRLLADSIIERYGFGKDLNESEERLIYNYYVENVISNGVYYHGFNSVFKDDIAKNGLSPYLRLWKPNDLDRIKEIGKKRGDSMILGWSDIQEEKSIWFASTPINAYRYAIASPEWFGQFVSEGFHISSANPEKKQAYYRGDYKRASKNIEELCEDWQSSNEQDVKDKKAYPNISDNEKRMMLDFFEKYWQVFKGKESKPLLAMIKRKSIFGERQYPKPYYKFKESYGSLSGQRFDIYEAIDFLRSFYGSEVNMTTDFPIYPKDIEIVSLPEYNRVFPLNE